MFTGEYRHSVDDKGRLAVPSRFRAQLDGGARRLALARRLPRDPHPGRLGRARRRRSRRCPSPTRALVASSGSSSPAPSRRRSTARAASSSRPTSARWPASTPRPSSSARATTPRSGLPIAGTTYRRSLEDPDALAEALAGPRDLRAVGRPHALPGSARDPSSDRWRRDEGRAPAGAGGGGHRRCSRRLPAAFRSTPRSAAVGTPSGSWRRPTLMAASSASTPMGRPSPESTPACGRGSAIGSSCARRTSGSCGRRPGRRLRRGRRAAVRPRPVELPAGRHRARLRHPDRRPARHALRHEPRRPGRGAARDARRRRADRALPPLRRGAAAPAGSPGRSSTRRSTAPIATAEELGRARRARRRPATPASGAGSIPRPASSRRSGSPSTKSSTHSRTGWPPRSTSCGRAAGSSS